MDFTVDVRLLLKGVPPDENIPALVRNLLEDLQEREERLGAFYVKDWEERSLQKEPIEIEEEEEEGPAELDFE